MELRDYQSENVEALRSKFRQGNRRVLFVSPTGSGKTNVFVYVTKGAMSRGLRVLILIHRQEILDQISRTLTAWEVPHGLLTAGRRIPQGYMVLLASVQTLVKQLEGSPSPDLIIIDEAHHACAQSWVKVFAAYPTSRVLGVTATPERLDGRGLGDFFDDMVLGPSVSWLIQNGFLARPKYFAPEHLLDTSLLKLKGGDFDKKQAAEVVDKPTITGNAVDHYRRTCMGQPAVAFCVSIEHANHVAAEFNAAGIKAAVIDGTMASDLRRSILDDLRERRILVLVSCELVSEGFDLPAVIAAILLRPTASLALHLQQIGRALRPCDGKVNAIILDHVGNCVRHGLAEETRDWSLDGHSAKKRTKLATLETRQCPSCYAIYCGVRCPQCGSVRESQTREIMQKEGRLVELRERELEENRHRKIEEKRCRTLEDFQRVGRERGYKPQWAFWRWKNSWAYRVHNQRNADATMVRS